MDWRSSGTWLLGGRKLVRGDLKGGGAGQKDGVGTHFTHLVVVFDERIYGFDGEKALVGNELLAILVFEDVGAYDSGEVVGVHFAAGFFVDL